MIFFSFIEILKVLTNKITTTIFAVSRGSGNGMNKAFEGKQWIGGDLLSLEFLETKILINLFVESISQIFYNRVGLNIMFQDIGN